jgi:hypothetical protein
VNRPRGKRLTFLIASLALAVIVGAAFASKDLILTTWYAHRLRSRDIDEQRTAIDSLGRLRTTRAARILAAYLGDSDSQAGWKLPDGVRFPPIPHVAALALMNMGEVAMEPLSEAFQIADDFDGGPKQLWNSGLQEMLFALLEIRREEPGVKSLLEKIGSRRSSPANISSGKYKILIWKSRVQTTEGMPCRIFLFKSVLQSWPDAQTILLMDTGGRVIAWKEVSVDPAFVSCELETLNGALALVITREDVQSKVREKHAYRLTLRGIEEQR